MKRQFVQIQPFQNKEERSIRPDQQRQGEPAAKTEWSPTTDAQPGVASASTRNVTPATYTPGMGLLSGWKAGRGSADGFNRNREASIAERATLEQPVVKGPVTGPAVNPDAAHAFATRSQAIAPSASPGKGNGYLRTGGLLSSTGQPLPAQKIMPIGVAMQSQPLLAPNMQTGAAPGAMPVMGTMAPVSNPRQVDPFGLPVVSPRTDIWSQAWPDTAQAGGYSSPASVSGYVPPGYRPPPGLQKPAGNANKRKKRRVPIWARVILVFVLIILLIGGAGAYYYETNFAAPVANITGQVVPRMKGDVNPNQNSTSGSGDILSGGRINILLLGSDTDQKFNGDFLAQTDIVVTIDPQTKYVGMLSIPRDTWLNAADGYGMMKLDQAYGRGGVGLSRATIYQDFGIPINYYGWVGLDGFIKVVNTVNGVDIDAFHPITDDNYPDDRPGSKNQYAYMRLYIAPGPQHMNGDTALEYVRSRHADLVGDFGRSQRQQQLLSALKLKLNNPSIVSELPQLANDLNGYVKTDMQLTDVFKLMNFARTINQSQIKQVVLDGQYSHTVGGYPTAYGPQDIVVLNCAAVIPVIAQMFGLGDQARCDTGISSTGKPTSTAVATVTTPSTAVSPALAGPVSSDSVWQVAQQMTEVSGLSYSDGSSSLMGMRSLLDLLCMTVFESPVGMQA